MKWHSHTVVGESLRVIDGHPSSLESVTCFFIDDSKLFTGHEDGVIKLWDFTNPDAVEPSM